MRIRQSDLASFTRCPQQKHLRDREKAGEFGQPLNLSMTAYGSVLHHALHAMETLHHQGREDALERALATFEYYWEPDHIAVICDPVTTWAARDTYSGLLRKGQATLAMYHQNLLDDKGKLLGLEVGFTLPIDIDGETHELHGTMDRLSLRKASNKSYVNIEDFKSGKAQRYLRWNAQFTTYAYATTLRQFWTDAWGEDEGNELFERFRLLPRRGTWIDVNGGAKRKDAGYRGDQDFERLRVALREYIRIERAQIYSLNLSGETCEWCAYRDGRCGGVPVPDNDYGRDGVSP